MTLPAYLALLDTLLRAAALEDAKAAQGPDAMARWAAVAVPRWDEISAKVTYAEIAQPMETAAWYTVWRDEQHRAGRWRYPAVSSPETGQGDDLTAGSAISSWPMGPGRDGGHSAARTREATIRATSSERAILPAASVEQLRL